MTAAFLPDGWREETTADGITFFTDADTMVGGRVDGGPALYVTPAVPGAPEGSIDATTFVEVGGGERLSLDQARSLANRLQAALGVAVLAERHAVAAAAPAEDRHVCPRREESPVGALGRYPEHDLWQDRDGERCCTYCGSRNPDDLMALLRAGAAELGPTDKNYKAYVRGLDGDHGKFYFQHLSVEQRREFVDLLNRKAFPIGYPGHFYVLPFFAQRGPEVAP